MGTAVEPVGARAVFLMERTDVKPAEREEFEKDQDAIRRRLLSQKQAAVLLAWQNDLLRRARPSEEAMAHLSHLPGWSREAL